eukprot:3019593-Karenia_brevis.AAC.1
MSKGAISLIPTEAKIQKILGIISEVLQNQFISPADLLSLRGHVVFLACSSYGKASRGAFKLLSIDNVYPDGVPKPSLRMGLHFFHELFAGEKPVRFVSPGVTPHKVILYTDASWETSIRGLGARLLDDEGQWSCSSHVPTAWLQEFKHRYTQIAPLELLAILGAVHTWEERIRGRYILLFVDNVSIASAVASGSSMQEDLQVMVTRLFRYLHRCEAK